MQKSGRGARRTRRRRSWPPPRAPYQFLGRRWADEEATRTVTTEWLSLQAAEALVLAGEQAAVGGPSRYAVLRDLAGQDPVAMAWALGESSRAWCRP